MGKKKLKKKAKMLAKELAKSMVIRVSRIVEKKPKLDA